MADEWTRPTLEEWQAEGVRLFGSDVNEWRFVCPSCGHVQTKNDWLKIGLGARMVDALLGFTCIGRWLSPVERVDFLETSKGFGCNYVGTMEPNISPVTIIISEDPKEERPTFGFDQS